MIREAHFKLIAHSVEGGVRSVTELGTRRSSSTSDAEIILPAKPDTARRGPRESEGLGGIATACRAEGGRTDASRKGGRMPEGKGAKRTCGSATYQAQKGEETVPVVLSGDARARGSLYTFPQFVGSKLLQLNEFLH